MALKYYVNYDEIMFTLTAQQEIVSFIKHETYTYQALSEEIWELLNAILYEMKKFYNDFIIYNFKAIKYN